MRYTTLPMSALLALSLGAGTLLAQEDAGAKKIPYIQGPSYPLSTCVVSGKKLGEMGKPFVFEHEGREVKLCCEGCKGKFEAEPGKYLEKIDQAAIKAQVERYPFDVCPITSAKLDSMGGPYDIVVGNRLIRLCCKGCEAKARAKASEILEKIDQAVLKKALAEYPLDICPVMKVKLGSMGEPINYLHGNQLVRFCCRGCIRKFEADPEKYLKVIEAARKKTGTKKL